MDKGGRWIAGRSAWPWEDAEHRGNFTLKKFKKGSAENLPADLTNEKQQQREPDLSGTELSEIEWQRHWESEARG